MVIVGKLFLLVVVAAVLVVGHVVNLVLVVEEMFVFFNLIPG